MSKPPLSISFHNFYEGFHPTDNVFARALRKRFAVEVETSGRDVQMTSVVGRQPLPTVPGKRPLRVWTTGEPEDPAREIFDLHFGFQPASLIGPRRWHRFPLWVRYIDWDDPTSDISIEKLLAPRRITPRARFCNFIYSVEASIRAEFFLRLNRARPVDSFGRVLNNRGERPAGRSGKLAVLRDSLFTIAFENRITPGYVTEKLLHPLQAGSIPIYWGAREALTDFNPEAFVYAPDFEDFDSLIRHVLDLAEDKDRLEAMATAPVFRGNEVAYRYTPDFFADRISEALGRDFKTGLGIDSGWIGHPFVPPVPETPRKRISNQIKRLRRRLEKPNPPPHA